MRKHGYGVALYPPPEVGGFTATNDKLNRGTVVVLLDTDSFSLVDDITFFTQYAELVTVEADEFQKLVERVDALEKALKKPTAKKATQKVEKELDTPADTE